MMHDPSPLTICLWVGSWDSSLMIPELLIEWAYFSIKLAMTSPVIGTLIQWGDRNWDKINNITLDELNILHVVVTYPDRFLACWTAANICRSKTTYSSRKSDLSSSQAILSTSRRFSSLSTGLGRGKQS